jgi:hypothetical protein
VVNREHYGRKEPKSFWQKILGLLWTLAEKIINTPS